MVAVLNQLDSAPWVPYLSIICVMGYIFGFAIGPGPIPWIWNTEFFKQSARAGGASEYIYWLSEISSILRTIRFTEKLSHFLCYLLGLYILGWSIFSCRSIRSGFKLMLKTQSMIGWRNTGLNSIGYERHHHFKNSSKPSVNTFLSFLEEFVFLLSVGFGSLLQKLKVI